MTKTDAQKSAEATARDTKRADRSAEATVDNVNRAESEDAPPARSRTRGKTPAQKRATRAARLTVSDAEALGYRFVHHREPETIDLGDDNFKRLRGEVRAERTINNKLKNFVGETEEQVLEAIFKYESIQARRKTPLLYRRRPRTQVASARA